EYVVEGISGVRLVYTLGDDEEGEIVVSQYGDSVLPQRFHEAHHSAGLGPAVHQIADEPQRIVQRIEGNAVEQPAQLLVTTLDVTDNVGAHGSVRKGPRPASGVAAA